LPPFASAARNDAFYRAPFPNSDAICPPEAAFFQIAERSERTKKPRGEPGFA